MPAAIPFGEFYTRNRRVLYGRAAWHLSQAQISGGIAGNIDDVVQHGVWKTLAWATEKAEVVAEDEMRAYCGRCIDHYVNDLRGKQARRGEVVGIPDGFVAVDERLQLTDIADCAELTNCLHNSMDEEERLIIGYRFYESLTYKGIAVKLGCFPPKVHGRVRSALVKLRRCLDDIRRRRK